MIAKVTRGQGSAASLCSGFCSGSCFGRGGGLVVCALVRSASAQRSDPAPRLLGGPGPVGWERHPDGLGGTQPTISRYRAGALPDQLVFGAEGDRCRLRRGTWELCGHNAVVNGRSWREKGGLVRRSPTMGSGGASRSLCVALHFSWLSPVHQREACATPLGALCFTEYYVRLSSAYRIRLALPSKFPSAFSVVSGNRSSGRSQHRGDPSTGGWLSSNEAPWTSTASAVILRLDSVSVSRTE